jgi:hypothetical protein
VFAASPAASIAGYIRAKDGNRPHLLDAAFAPDATLRMVVQTDAIAFPPTSQGREAIAQTLVRRFNQTYENVYTLCLGAPPQADATSFSCDWLVAMSEKESGAVRIGCGRYDWVFDRSSHQVQALTITIAAMEILDAVHLGPVMTWASALPYPWCGAEQAIAAAPAVSGLSNVLRALQGPGRASG